MEFKRGMDSLGGPKPEQGWWLGDSLGVWGGGSERLSPCPSLSPGEGPACLPLISTPSAAQACHRQPQEISPWRGPDGPVTTVPSRPAGPSLGNLLSPGTLSFSLPQLPAQSREGRAHRAEKLSFFPEQMTLGQGWEQLGRNSNSLGLQQPWALPVTSQGVNLHLGQLQTKLDSWELLLSDPRHRWVSSFRVTLCLLPKNPAPGSRLAESDIHWFERQISLGSHLISATSWLGDLGQLALPLRASREPKVNGMIPLQARCGVTGEGNCKASSPQLVPHR